MNEVVNRALRSASKKHQELKVVTCFLNIVTSTYKMLTPARFGRYGAENFRTVAQKYGAQRVAGVFFKKKPGLVILTFQVGGQVTKF